MSLSALIRKRDTGNLATAIPTISATQPKGEAATVARIATVAVATTDDTECDDASSSNSSDNGSTKGGARDTASSRRWLLHFSDREPFEVAFSPAAGYAGVVTIYPSVLAAEPLEAVAGQASVPISGDEEGLVIGWLAQIGEIDPEISDAVLKRCRRDGGTRDYFLARAAEVCTDGDLDDRRF